MTANQNLRDEPVAPFRPESHSHPIIGTESLGGGCSSQAPDIGQQLVLTGPDVRILDFVSHAASDLTLLLGVKQLQTKCQQRPRCVPVRLYFKDKQAAQPADPALEERVKLPTSWQ